ncbi:MAG: bifunctional nuclease family protein [Trueperaceae bacterium]|nr:MAG: bifunctional nuclease family protein [Trueperaceae bacterium]
MVEAVLEDIAVAGDGNQFLVLLRTKDDDILPIVIDALQAISIAAGRNQEKIERPLTHDLLLSLIELFDAQIDRIEITDLVDGTYYAILVLVRGGVQFEVDARPSDAMALAVRVKAPIWIAEHVLEQNALTEDYSGGSGESFQA